MKTSRPSNALFMHADSAPDSPVAPSVNRETWLTAAIDALRLHFAAQGYTVPEHVRATCGFPSRSALSTKNRRIGECWDAKNSTAGVFEMFISPVIAAPLDVLAILAHEMVHATVGLKAGHKAPFKRCALAIGLAGKMTATHAGEAFKQFADTIMPGLGEYPHGKLSASNRAKTQGTRLLKCTCPDCGYTVRVTQTWLDNPGPPVCPACTVAMVQA